MNPIAPDFYHNNLQHYPRDHNPQIILGLVNTNESGEYVRQLLPMPYPCRLSNIDALKKTARSRPVSLPSMEVILQKYLETVKDAKTQHARFDELRDEREYYKNYLPTTTEQITRLNHEIEDLNYASKSIILNKGQIDTIKSRYNSHQNQSYMIEKNVNDEIREQDM